MQQNNRISMVLVGEGPLVSALQKALTEKMDEAGIGEIELVQELEPASQNPVLVVKVKQMPSSMSQRFPVSEPS
jgi:hypothetical protein